MTPNDVPGPIITAETLQPWLIALTPAVEPVRSLPKRPAPEPLPLSLRPAA
jgi:hypothetical protein